MSELDAPCLFCGYNGPGYWQSGTHSTGCPWREVGGAENRDVRAALSDTAGEGWLEVREQAEKWVWLHERWPDMDVLEIDKAVDEWHFKL